MDEFLFLFLFYFFVCLEGEGEGGGGRKLDSYMGGVFVGCGRFFAEGGWEISGFVS